MTRKKKEAIAAKVREKVLQEVADMIRGKIEVYGSPYPDGCLNSVMVARNILREVEYMASVEENCNADV